ncbi:MAG: hypothetical protein JWP89_3598 [Schlesneria sp.]|nr:hypothetical protein [Schlesneria sp.]
MTHIDVLLVSSRDLEDHYSLQERQYPYQATEVRYNVSWTLHGDSRFWQVTYICEPQPDSRNPDDLFLLYLVNDATGQLYPFPPLPNGNDLVSKLRTDKTSNTHEPASIQSLKKSVESCTYYPGGLLFVPRMTPVDALLATVPDMEGRLSQQHPCPCEASKVEFFACWNSSGHSTYWHVTYDCKVEPDNQTDPDGSHPWYVVNDDTGQAYPFPTL